MKIIEEAAEEFEKENGERIWDENENGGTALCVNSFIAGVEFAQQWIPVEDELPDFDIDVIWKMDSGHYFVSDIDHDCDFDTLKKIYESPLLDEFECQDKITHWRPVELK